MKNENFEWLLTNCHHISEVALAYYPHYANTSTAVKALRRSFREHVRLQQELLENGYTDKTLHLTPLQIAAIVRCWGLPSHVQDMIEKNPYLTVPKKHGKI